MFFAGSSESGPADAALWSDERKADKGLEISWQMIESSLVEARTQPEREDYLMGISSRLQAALEKMLMAITDTTDQVRPPAALLWLSYQLSGTSLSLL